MTWPLPRSVAKAVGVDLQVVDYAVADKQAKAVAGGTATITFDQVPGGYLWRVERIVVTTTSAQQVTVTAYAGDALPIRLRDSTPLPVGYSAVGEYPAMLTILDGLSLLVVVSGGVAGDTVTASVQYQLVQRAAAGG
ncbi:MAG: hypothetical protein JWL97_3810 [Gemmatimonadales bacterium]|nr:hypothetical protein [Gemmatimonadales bacterium]